MDYVNLTFILVSTITSKVIQNTSFNVPHFLHIACMCILLLNTPLIFFIFPNARWWYLKEKKRDTTNNTSKFRCEECWKDQLIAEMRRKMLELYCCVINFCWFSCMFHHFVMESDCRMRFLFLHLIMFDCAILGEWWRRTAPIVLFA